MLFDLSPIQFSEAQLIRTDILVALKLQSNIREVHLSWRNAIILV